MAAAFAEAKERNVKHAVLVMHSFGTGSPSNKEAFEDFVALYEKHVVPATLTGLAETNGIAPYTHPVYGAIPTKSV